MNNSASQDSFDTLRFLHDLKAAPLSGLLDCDFASVPQSPGVYLLVASSANSFLYPNGRSAVFYIGQGTDLRTRLRRRRQQIKSAQARLTHQV